MELVKQTKSKTTEVIDGNQYTECRFENCQLVYRGGEIPRISRCHFENCTWQFEEAAERTLLFLKFLYHGMGIGGKELIEATVAAIRQPLA
jgi:hypothetical protein